VLCGVRYKLVPGEVKAYVRGLYGRPPAPINPEIQKKIIGAEEPLTVRPADILEPGLAKAERESAGLARSPEDVISYAIFPQVAKKFFEDRQGGVISREKTKETKETQTALLSKEDLKLNLQELKELIKIIDETEISELNLESDGVKISIRKGPSVVTGIPVTAIARQEGVERSVAPSTVQPTPSIEAFSKAPDPVVPTNAEMITSPMVGTFYSSQSPEAPAFVNVGQQVKVGQPVCIVEAMKLMNEIESEIEGKIIQILVENGQPVEYGQPLFIIENKEK
jgi:oxaloacetate decarboxylase alpha subunit